MKEAVSLTNKYIRKTGQINVNSQQELDLEKMQRKIKASDIMPTQMHLTQVKVKPGPMLVGKFWIKKENQPMKKAKNLVANEPPLNGDVI